MKTQASRHNNLNLAQKINLFGITTLATLGASFFNIEPVFAQTVFATRQILSLKMKEGQPQRRLI